MIATPPQGPISDSGVPASAPPLLTRITAVVATRRGGVLLGILLLLGLASFLPFLDRYPEPYFDDAFFNNPAVRSADGQSFAWPASTEAPHGTWMWAYHGLFYPYMQVVTVRVLGATQFACRVPQYVAAFMALALMCYSLRRWGYIWTGLGAVVLWLGDRAMVEILYGRMEGLALLFLALLFVVSVRSVRSETPARLLLAGCSAGIAACFHPSTAVFGMCAGGAISLMHRQGLLRRFFIFSAGFLIPVAATILIIAPHFREAAEQFAYNRFMASRNDMLSDLAHLIHALRWSRYWQIVLLPVSLLTATWLAVQIRKQGRSFIHQHPVVFFAGVFAVSGIATVSSTSMYSYYLVYSSLWCIILVAAVTESGLLFRGSRMPVLAVWAVLLVAWLPSSAWNLLRWREAATGYATVDVVHFHEQIRRVVPSGRRIMFSPDYFILARGIANHDFLLPYDNADITWRKTPGPIVAYPAGSYLVLSYDHRRSLDPAAFNGRKLIYQGALNKQRPAGEGSFYVFAPDDAVQ